MCQPYTCPESAHAKSYQAELQSRVGAAADLTGVLPAFALPVIARENLQRVRRRLQLCHVPARARRRPPAVVQDWARGGAPQGYLQAAPDLAGNVLSDGLFISPDDLSVQYECSLFRDSENLKISSG